MAVVVVGMLVGVWRGRRAHEYIWRRAAQDKTRKIVARGCALHRWMGKKNVDGQRGVSLTMACDS